MPDRKIKINLGCGNDIKAGYLNCDRVNLPGVDKIVDLDQKLPFENESVDEILAIDVLEHVSDFIMTMEELHRVIKKGGRLFLQVPYWNSWCRHADPTHKMGFHEKMFSFFDPETPEGKERGYYSNAKFRIIALNPVLYPFSPFINGKKIELRNQTLKKIAFFAANYLNSIVIDLSIILERV